MSIDDYSDYTKAAHSAAESEERFQTFKQDPEYTKILEHVSFFQGVQYLQGCWNLFQLQDKDVELFCSVNGRLGSPAVYEYSSSLTCSPTSIRYIFHSHVILQYIQSLGLKEVSIVEVGCGYGGLFLALQHFAPKMGIQLNKYACVDLHEAITLQQKYLSKHTLGITPTFHDAMMFGADIQDTNLFFISNYAFSEISKELQENYIKHLLPKCAHGFIAWNLIDIYDFGKQIRVTEEIPQTGPKNKFVYF